MRTITQIGVDRELLKAVAPETPMQQDEQGGCVWCGEDSWNAGSYKDYDRHDEDCPWGRVRKLICESAESTADSDGMVSPLEFRDYIRSRGYGAEEDFQHNDRICSVYGYDVRSPKKRVKVDSYSLAEGSNSDNIKRPLAFAKNWCDEQDVKKVTSVRGPD